METRINVAELLRNCPRGMELDCTMWEEVVFDRIVEGVNYPIHVKKKDGIETLTENGCYHYGSGAKCVIFPKGKTTWEGFVPPVEFKDSGKIHTWTIKDAKDGDVLSINWCKGGDSWEKIIIFKKYHNEGVEGYGNTFKNGELVFHEEVPYFSKTWTKNLHPATKEQCNLLFQKIKEAGYKWDEESKTLEKLIEPRFKVGDRITPKCSKIQYEIMEVTDTHYTLVEVTKKFEYTEPIAEDKNWDLVPDKFDISTLKPYKSEVLYRNTVGGYWKPAFWGAYTHLEGYKGHKFLTTQGFAHYCIPYEGNEHLMGKQADCSDFYKTWEE